MADETATSVENQETLQAAQAFALLTLALGVVPSQDGTYTPDWGEAVSKAVAVNLEDAQHQANLINKDVRPPMIGATAQGLLSTQISEVTGLDARTIAGLIGSSDQLIDYLDSEADKASIPVPLSEQHASALMGAAMVNIEQLGNLLDVPTPDPEKISPQDYAKSVQDAYDQALAKEIEFFDSAAGGRVDSEQMGRKKLIDDLASKIEAAEFSQRFDPSVGITTGGMQDRNSAVEKLLYDLERNAEFVYEVVGKPSSTEPENQGPQQGGPQGDGVQVSAQEQKDAGVEIGLLVTALGIDVPTDQATWQKSPQSIEDNIATRVEGIRSAEGGAALSDGDVRTVLAKQIADEYSQKIDGKPAEDDRVAKVASLLDQRAGNYTILGLPTPTVSDPAVQGEQNVVKSVPVEPVPADIQQRVQGLEAALVKIVDAQPDANLPKPGAVDGILDQQSFASYSATLAHLKTAAGLDGDFPDAGYSPELGEELGSTLRVGLRVEIKKLEAEKLLLEGKDTVNMASAEDKARIAEITGQITSMQDARRMVPGLIEDLNYLHEKDALKPVEMREVTVSQSQNNVADNNDSVPSGGGAQGAPEGGDDSTISDEQMDLEDDVRLVKEILQGVAAQLPDQMGGLVGGGAGQGLNIAGFDLGGLANGIMSDYTLTDAEVKNGEFGEKENNILAVALMGIKTLNGEEGANGVYDDNAKATLQKVVLTSPAFQSLRDEKGLPTISASHYEQYEKALQAKSSSVTDNPEASYNKTIQAFEEKYKAGISGVGAITDALDNLQKNQLIDNQKAAQKTQESVMGNMFMQALDSVGMGGFIRDFFNSEFGQMIGSFLGMIGIDVDFILGNTEKPETGQALEQKSITRAESAFDTALAKAQEANPDASFEEQMAAVVKDYEGSNSGVSGALKNAALSVTVGKDNVSFMNAAIKEALEKASETDSPEAAKAAFRTSLRDSASAYTSKQAVELSGQTHTASSSTITGADVASGFDAVVRGVEESDPELLKQLRNDANARNQAGSLPPADAIKLDQDNTYATVTVKMDDGEYPQDPTRFANAEGLNRVQPIAQFLIDNGESLGLDADNLATLTKEDGSVVDVMTPGFNAVVQELWVEANIHEQLEAGKPVTEEFIRGIPEFDPYDAGEPTGQMKIVEDYAKAQKGVDGDEFDAMFHANIQSLDTDYGSSADGQTQADSVWEQSFKIGEIIVDIMQYQPRQAADVDMNDGIEKAYLAAQDPNSDCEIPVFVPDEKTGDVYVLIRDKNPEDGQPEIQKLKMDDYLNTGKIDPAIVQELVDNYNWQGEVDHAKDARLGEDAKLGEYTIAEKTAEIIKYMEDCLGIRAVDTSCVVNSGECRAVFNDNAEPKQPLSAIYVTEDVRYTELANASRDGVVPDTFNEMRFLSIEDANEITLALEEKYGELPTRFEEGVSNYANNVDRPTLYEDDNEYKRLEDMFLKKFGSQGEGYMFMDLETMGIEHPDVDVVVVHKRGNDVDFRFLDNDEDRVVSIAEQRENGPKSTSTRDDFQNGDRSLDSLLAYHKFDRKMGPAIQGPAEGYRGAINAVIPSNDGSDIKSVRASNALFDREDQEAYRKAHASMWNERGSYLVTKQENRVRVVPDEAPAQKVGTSKVFGEEVGGGPEASNDDIIQENAVSATGNVISENPEIPGAVLEGTVDQTLQVAAAR